MRVVAGILRAWTTVLCSMISSVCSTKSLLRVQLLLLLVRIKILASASIIWHVKCIFNAWWPLSLSISHREMRVSVSQFGVSSLISSVVVILITIILIFCIALSRRASSSQSSLIWISVLFSLAWICRWFIVNFWLFRINKRLPVSSRSALLLLVDFLVIIHLILKPWLNVIIPVGVVYNRWSFCSKTFICVSGMILSSLRSVLWCKPRHSCSTLMTIPIGIWSILHPRFLVSFRRRAIAHDDTSILLATNHTILSIFTVLVLILRQRSI
jgi:hypothetical protein